MDTILLFVFVITLLLSYIALSKPRGLPPGPWSLPLLGSYFFLQKVKEKREHLSFSEAATKYGKIFYFRIGSYPIMVLQGYEAIHQALVKQGDVFSDRASFLPGFRVLPKNGKGIGFHDYNHHCKELRKFTLKGFGNISVIQDAIMTEIDAVSGVLAATEGNPLNISPMLQKMIANVHCKIMFGKRFDFNDSEFVRIIDMLNVTKKVRVGLTSAALYFPPWVTRLFSGKDEKKNRLRLQCSDTISDFISNQLQQHEDTFDKNNIRDMADLCIQASGNDKQEIRDTFTKGTIRQLIRELISGSENTFGALDWAILLMSENPEIQKRCQEEMDTVVGDKRVQYSERVSLKYVNATLFEVQRYANVTPMGVPHCTSKDTRLMGYHIPKKTIVIPNLYSSNMDPELWTEPHIFKPSRFLDEAGNLFKNNGLMPFSVGPRKCPGEPLSRMSMFLAFANLLQRYSFAREHKEIKHSMAMDPSNQVTSYPYPYKVRIIKR